MGTWRSLDPVEQISVGSPGSDGMWNGEWRINGGATEVTPLQYLGQALERMLRTGLEFLDSL